MTQLNKRDYLEIANLLGIAGLSERTSTWDIYVLIRRELTSIQAALAVTFPDDHVQGVSTFACQKRIVELYKAAERKGVDAKTRIDNLNRQAKARGEPMRW